MHDKDAIPIEAIDYELLQQPAEQKPNRRVNNKFIIWFAFSFLILCALLVFVLLPSYVDKKQKVSHTEQPMQIETHPAAELNDPKTLTEPVIVSAEPLSTEERNALKQQAEELLLQIIEKQKLLESKAVKKWSSEEFKIALALGSSGDEYFRKQQYRQAITSYEEAIIVLIGFRKTNNSHTFFTFRKR